MDKTKDAYKTIGEVSRELDILPHVLRFWEIKFDRLKLIKRKDFMEYMDKVTPLNYYQKANISSRPDRRGNGSKSISDLRAIPFVGAWSQIRQNVPGYYGLGTAISDMIKDDNESFGDKIDDVVPLRPPFRVGNGEKHRKKLQKKAIGNWS